MVNWRNTIPWGLFVPFLIIILLEYLFSFGLDWYNKSLANRISEKEKFIITKENELKKALENDDAFVVFSKAVNLVDILQNRPSLKFTIRKFNDLMPKFLTIRSFIYDAEKNEIEFNGSVNTWFEYMKLYNYVSNHSDWELKSFTSPQQGENFINFNMVLNLKPSFYK